MKLYINWKKTLVAVFDLFLLVYLVAAMTSFNKPDETAKVCTKVNINIADDNANGFLSASEIKRILQRNRLYPLEAKMQLINPRQVEELLMTSPFVKTAECYKTQDGHVCINITQRLPLLRIKNETGDDYYLDDKGGIMPNSKYTSDLLIASGHINKTFATHYLSTLAATLSASEFWRNQIEQVYVLPDQGIELVPRVGNHILFIGYLPKSNNKAERQQLITDYVNRKLTRLEKFYKYGLSEAGWNKYEYISMEFDNQIICKKHPSKAARVAKPANVTQHKDSTTTAQQPNATSNSKQEKTVKQVETPTSNKKQQQKSGATSRPTTNNSTKNTKQQQ